MTDEQTPVNFLGEDVIDEGRIPLRECDHANIPVNIYVVPIDPRYGRDGSYAERGYKWMLYADNYMPRRARSDTEMYRVYARTRESIIAYMHKYITPWYEAAAKHMREAMPDSTDDGGFSLYYWPDPPKEPA